MNVLLLVAASVTLAWNSSPDAVSYRLYVGISPGESLQWYPTQDTLFNVTGLDFGTTYYFRATALTGEGVESGYSNEVQFTPMPEPTVTPDDDPGLHKGWFK